MQARTNVEALVGQFASGMSNLLGNLVQGWTAMTMGDGAEVANQFRNFVPGGTSRPIGSRGRYKYNDSQVLPGSEDEFMNDLQDSDVDDYVRGNDGHAGHVQMDNVQSDPQNQQSRVVDDVVAAAKVSAAPLSSAPGPSKDGAEVSKRGRDSEDEVRVSFAKRPKFDPVAARRRFGSPPFLLFFTFLLLHFSPSLSEILYCNVIRSFLFFFLHVQRGNCWWQSVQAGKCGPTRPIICAAEEGTPYGSCIWL